jgi:ATP-dependent Clp protease ATP-binding subunit ClpA
LNLAENVIDLLVEKGYDSKMGARPLSRKIDEMIRVPLSKRILFDRLDNCVIYAVLVNDTIEFQIIADVQPRVDSDGYIVIENVAPEV